jgi:putative membrane protein
MGGMMPGGMGALMGTAFLFWLLLLVGIVLLGVWLVRQVWPGRASASPPPSADSPLTILQRRYASGELGADDYERMRSQLLRDHEAR